MAAIGEGVNSFNWLMRTLAGYLFGLATIWMIYPRLEPAFRDAGHRAQVELDGFIEPRGSLKEIKAR